MHVQMESKQLRLVFLLDSSPTKRSRRRPAFVQHPAVACCSISPDADKLRVHGHAEGKAFFVRWTVGAPRVA